MRLSGYKEFKNPLGLRGDYFYCPLSLVLDAYWNCSTRCAHCFLRRLNRTWGEEQRLADPEKIRRRLLNGLKNPHPKSDLAVVLKLKKTIRFGNKSDPFQPDEQKFGVAGRILEVLADLNWNAVIQTKGLSLLREHEELLFQRGNFVVLAVVTCGLEKDWELLEGRRTTNPIERLRILSDWKNRGLRVGVNGEPFIPGYHSEKDFEETMKLLKSLGLDSYNVYNLHMNDWVLKSLLEAGLDIERIYHLNQDWAWRRTLRRLLEIADRYGVRVACPDFVNTGLRREPFNTCCGVDVDNPMRFNTHFWKPLWMEGLSVEEIIQRTYEGYGDLDKARRIISGEELNLYTMKDVVRVNGGKNEV